MRAAVGRGGPLPQRAHGDFAADDDEHRHYHCRAVDGRWRGAGQQNERRRHHELVCHRVQEGAKLGGDVPLRVQEGCDEDMHLDVEGS